LLFLYSPIPLNHGRFFIPAATFGIECIPPKKSKCLTLLLMFFLIAAHCVLWKVRNQCHCWVDITQNLLHCNNSLIPNRFQQYQQNTLFGFSIVQFLRNLISKNSGQFRLPVVDWTYSPANLKWTCPFPWKTIYGICASFHGIPRREHHVWIRPIRVCTCKFRVGDVLNEIALKGIAHYMRRSDDNLWLITLGNLCGFQPQLWFVVTFSVAFGCCLLSVTYINQAWVCYRWFVLL
jgi:hypothetical protein